jgi:hypothetical protein
VLTSEFVGKFVEAADTTRCDDEIKPIRREDGGHCLANARRRASDKNHSPSAHVNVLARVQSSVSRKLRRRHDTRNAILR